MKRMPTWAALGLRTGKSTSQGHSSLLLSEMLTGAPDTPGVLAVGHAFDRIRIDLSTDK